MGKPQDIKFKNGLNVNGISLVDKNGKLTHPDLKSYTRDIVTDYNDVIVSRCKGALSRLASLISGMLKGKCFGDSICQGTGASTLSSYPDRLALRLYENIKAIYGVDLSQWSYVPDNYGMPSANLTSTLAYFAHTLDANCNVVRNVLYDVTIDSSKVPVAFMTLTTGVNDRFAFSYTQFERAYRMAVKMVIRAGIDMICITEPPELKPAADGYHADKSGALGTENSWSNYYMIADIIRRIAADEGASLVDIHKAWLWENKEGVNLYYYYTDYVHPNDTGYDKTAILVAKCVTTQDVKPSKRLIGTTYTPENMMYALFQYNTSALSSASEVDIVSRSFPYTCRYVRTGDYKIIKIDNGGYATFNFPDVPIYGVYVAVMFNQVTKANVGTMSVEVNGVTHTTIYDCSANAGSSSNEFGFYFPYEGASGPVKVKCSGGAGKSIHVLGVTVLQPLNTVKHTTITGAETGTWSTVTVDTYSWRESSTPGDTITLKWFGTDLNIIANIGTDKGKISVANDGGTATTTDLYNANGNATTILKVATNLKLGWHTTVFTVVAKNASSSANKVQIRDCRIYGAALQDGTVFAMGGSGVTINCPDGVNNVETTGVWTITNNGTTVTADTYSMVKCTRI